MKEFVAWTCPSCQQKIRVDVADDTQFITGGLFMTRYLDPALDSIEEQVERHSCEGVS